MKMKKMYFKKIMSVFMACLMLLSCWVWIAPEKASAAAGNYYVKIRWQVKNTKNYSNKFGGTETEDGARAGIILYYKSNNGTGTENSMYWDIGNSGNYGGTCVSATKSSYTTDSTKDKDYYLECVVAGFPTAVYSMADSDNAFDTGEHAVYEIYVGSSTSDYKTIWKGTGFVSTMTNKHYFKISSNGDNTVDTSEGSDSSSGYASTDSAYTNSWVYPYADTSTVSWSNPPEAMTCPETGTNSQEVAVTAKDQYGVQMFDPTWTVKGSSCDTTGISVDPSTSSETTTIKLTNAANIDGTTNSQTGTVTATWKGAEKTVTNSKDFTINDSLYTATFTGHTDADGVVQEDIAQDYRHGMTPVAPDAYSYQDGDYDVTFTGWSPSVGAITSDTTYTAVYSRSDKILADYTAVNEAIAAANQLKTDLGAEYELKYTQESRLAVESAINAVVTGLGRTQQTVVDGYAQAINDAVAALEVNKFNVIFLDEEDRILLFETDVEYKAEVTPPADEDGYYDSTNHYTFSGWSTDGYLSVTEDLFVYPVYAAEAHSFTETTVASTCTQAGGTLYECSCGYSYVVGETDPDAHVWEADYTIDLEPTCTVAGSKSIHCSLCDATKDITEIPATGHSWGEESEVIAPTCTGNGVKAKVCTVCSACEHTLVPALTHDYVETVVAPTCTTKGYTEYTCQRTDCKHSYRDTYKDIIDHSFGEWKEVHAAACEGTGTEKRTCTECGFIELRSTEALSHDVPDNWTVVVPATCEGTGYQTKTCTRCGVVRESEVIPATGHSDTTETKNATCTEAGYTKVVCSTCGKTETTIHQPLGHSYDDGVHSDADCTHGGFTTYTCGTCGHSYITLDDEATANDHNFVGGTETVVTPATCTTDGEKTVQCVNDGCEYKINVVIPKTGHNHVAGDAEAPTCTTSGYTPYTCTACGDAYNVYDENEPATGHDFSGEGTVVTAATCTTDGTKTVKCANCDETQNVTIPATGHDFSGEATTEAATCTEDGTETVKCANANCEETQTTVLPKTGHTWGEWVITDATNENDGSATRTCEKDATHIETVVIPAGGHVWDNGTVTTPATCTTKGEKVYKCTEHTDCGITITVTLDEIQHTVATEKLNATCTQDGYIKTYCSVCKEEFSNETTKKIAHSYVAGDAVAPTCTTSGYTPYTCSVCDDTYNVYDAAKKATGHTYVEGDSTATCTAGGTMTLKCACGATTEIDVPALGHNYVKDETASTEATCAAAATETYKCSGCGDSYTVSDGDKLTGDDVHSWGGWQVKESATSASIGYRTNTCTVCGQIKVETIEATGEHTFTDGEIVKSSPATCTEDGYEERACSTHTGDETCGQTSTITLPKLGHSEVLEYKAAACETKGSTKIVCSVCGTTIEEKEIPKLGHAWSEGEVTNSNCSEKGKIEYSCTREGCNGTYEVELQRNSAHDYVTTITAASCTKEGSIVVKCTRCSSNSVNEAIAKLEHTWGDTPVSTTDATCETDGSETYKCQKCDATNVVTVTKTGHTWGEWEVTKASANTENGEMSRSCQNSGCTETETVEIPAGGHNLVESSKTDATCTQKGSVTYDCDVHTGDEDCGITVTVTLDEIQHTLTTSTTDAKCEADGSVVTKCENCDTATVTTVIPATGHSYEGIVTTAATCTTEGEKTYTCAHDATHTYTEVIAKLQHNYVAGEAVKATCTSSGYTPYECETCDSGYVLITENAKGHTFEEGDSTADCTTAGKMTLKCDCGVEMTAAVPALGHDYKLDSATEATCAAAATETYKCSRCDAAYTISVGSKTDKHDFDDWKVVENATETSLGYETKTCKVCGKLEVQKIEATGEHKFTIKIEAESKEATCEEAGYETYRCSAHTDCTETSVIDLPKLGHTEKHVYSAATCTGEGLSAMECEVCNKTLSSSVIPALGHSWGTGTVTSQPTCSVEGEISYECSRTDCGATKTEKLPTSGHALTTTTVDAKCEEDGSVVTTCLNCNFEQTTVITKKGHTWSDTPASTTNATCEAEGSKVYECVNCDEQKTVTVPKLGHSYVAGDEVAPTCTTSGYTVYVCENDSAHTYNVYDADKPATGHTWGEWNVITSATETTDGLKQRTCACGGKEEEIIPAMKHNLTEQTRTEPTCDKEGEIIYKCSVDHEGVVCSYTLTVTLEKLAHTLTTSVTDAECDKAGAVVTTCENCGNVNITTEIPATGHSYVGKVTTEATCTKEGEKTYTCAHDATHTYTEVIAKLQHNYVEGEEVAATCTQYGYITYACSACGDSYVVITSAAKGHTYVEGDSTATCEAAGTMTLTCACGAEMTADVPALGHDYQPGASTAATCASAATQSYDCSRCDASYTVSVGSKTENHKWGEWKVVEQETEVSLGYETRECTVCGKLEVKTIPAIGEHEFTIYIANESKAPSCEEAGYEVYRCSAHTDCTEVSKVEIPATGHTKTQNYVAPTCENDGVSAVVCTVCGETLESTVVPALGHSWSAGVITKQPGCFSEGEITYSCSRTDCDATKTEAVQPTGHIWDNGKVITESTCTVGGEKLFKCTGCDAEKTEILNPLGHSYGRVVTPSTCTEQGYTTYTCVKCGDTFVTSYTDAAGHSVGAWVITKEVSCAEDGERSRYCSECDYYETEAIPANEHSWGEWRLIGADVCGEGAVRQRECAACGTAERDVLEDGEHFYRTDENGNIIFDNILMPACEHEGFYIYRCTLCGSEVKFTAATPGYEEELAATGHNWQTDANGHIVYVTVKAVTCFTDGQKYRTCTNENCHLDYNREYITVTTVGHQLKSMNGKDATCEESGYSNYYVCVVCGYEHNKVIYPAMGHIDESGDGVCDSCKSTINSDSSNSGNSSEDCDCMCHKGGFMGIIYKIISFFWKLFGTNETCDCGEAHY